jgi:hypothetical protein
MAAPPNAAALLDVPSAVGGEAELVARLAAMASGSVAVVEVYAEAWGPCRCTVAAMKKLRADHDDAPGGAELALLSFAAERVGGAASAHAAASAPSAAPAATAAAAAALSALATIAARRGKSEPLFLVFRGGMLRHVVRGADPPKLAALVEELLPAAAAASAAAAGGAAKEAPRQPASAEDDDDEGGAGGAGGGPAGANPFAALVAAVGVSARG